MKNTLANPPGWKWWAKWFAIAAVGAATTVQVLAPDATPRQIFCAAVVGAGAALGIGSGGVGRR